VTGVYGPQEATCYDVVAVGDRARAAYRPDLPHHVQDRAAEAAYEWTVRAAANTSLREAIAAHERDQAAQPEPEAGQ
jgi:hypothetical protein